MHLLQDIQIAIVGGGPGGLTLARLLEQKGASVKVYERDLHKDVRVQGATLDLHEESGLRALEEAGLMDAFQANYRPGADRMRLTDHTGHILLDEHVNAQQEMFRPEIDRGPLRKILLESLRPDTVVWNSQTVGISVVENGWTLHFKNGNTAFAHLVIGADGARSVIRPHITTVPPFYAGMTIVEGTVYDAAHTMPALDQLLNGGKIFALGHSQSLILSSKGDGSLVFYTGMKTPEHWQQENQFHFNTREQTLDWFRQSFSQWSDIWYPLWEKATLPFVLRPQYCMPPQQTWASQGALTMLGDAAHLMPPYAGEGVNMAMQDALELSHCLTSDHFTNLPAAIEAYEQQMCHRAGAVATMTLEQTEALHSPGAVEHMTQLFA